jgi:hypothetical protein
LGLYVVGRSDAELLADYEMEHEAVLTVLRPTGPIVDSLIELMAGLVASVTFLKRYPPRPRTFCATSGRLAFCAHRRWTLLSFTWSITIVGRSLETLLPRLFT